MDLEKLKAASRVVLKAILRAIINCNIRGSRLFDMMLPSSYRVDGNRYFIERFAPPYIKANQRVYDIGGGKRPYIDLEWKKRLRLCVIGLDIDERELRRAPKGSYDKSICCDITSFSGAGDGDVVVCQALLEHVHNVEAAFLAMSSILKPGGVALIFVPSRNAAFARLNLLLPQRLKEFLLFSIYPKARGSQGFPSYYDRCTPRGFRVMAHCHGFSVEEESFYYTSSYFSFCFPLYVMWRIWVIGFRLIAKENACETFCMALRKT